MVLIRRTNIERDYGPLILHLRSPQNVNGISADPRTDWSTDSLLSELDAIEKQLNATTSDFRVPLTKKKPREVKALRDDHRSNRPFVMRVLDNDYSEDDDNEEEPGRFDVVAGRKFCCDDLYLSSDDSEDESQLHRQRHLMDRMALVEGALRDQTRDLQLSVTELVRSKISTFESEVANEEEKFASLLNRIEKQRELQQERERKIDLQYQRTIAEALDNHLTAIQRDHEHTSQLEERRIRDDAAREEAKRKEKAIQEEKLRQEKMKEEEDRLNAERAKAAAIEAERARAASIEAERKVAEEAESKRASEASAKSVIRASENALELEKRRMQIYEEVSKRNNTIRASSDQNLKKYGHHMSRLLKTISASAENISIKAEELVKLINNPACPQSIGLQLFAEKIVTRCTNVENLDSVFFAIGRVIVLVTSQVPQAMDILIAELNRVCIYTVPKHITYSKVAFESKDAYLKAIGYKEDDNTDNYVQRLCCYMKLYGALVQTEVRGFENLHGLEQGWAWLARFLNALPANLYTASALYSFLEVAGFALHRRYRNQFEKLMNIIARDFLNALKKGSSGGESQSFKLKSYIDSRMFQKEPEGLQIRQVVDSRDRFGTF